MLELLGPLTAGWWWLHKREPAAPVAQRPMPLLQMPLGDHEMGLLTGLAYSDRSRLAMLSPKAVAAIDKALTDEVEAMFLVTVPEVVVSPSIFFKPGEPTTFEEYGGQTHITRYFQACLNGIGRDEPLVLDPQALSGVAGGGKTLLAKVTANELRERAAARGESLPDFIECFTTDVPNVGALDRLMRRVQASPHCVLFIDELHTIEGKEHWTKFLEVLENRRYQFDGEPYPVVLPPFTVMAATTDYGTLSEPWRRRFQEQRFERSSYDQLLSYVMNRRVLDITPEAGRAIIDRTHWGGQPWEALWAYKMAVVFAKERQSTTIDIPDVETVWTVNRVDEFGLRPVDRDVLAALFKAPRTRRERLTGEQEFVCFAMSEDNVVQAARVDRAEYKDYIRPKLMTRQLLEIKISYGQALTQLAVDRYGYLRESV